MATKIFLPRLGESVEEATIGKWCKQVGDAVSRGDLIAELETAKAMMELECPVKGVLLAVFPEIGETIQMGDLVAIVGKAGEDWQAEIGKEEKQTKKEEPKKRDLTKPGEKTEVKPASGRIRISPNAKRLAQEKGLDLSELAREFPDKRITADDIEKMATKSASKIPVRKVELTKVQMITAERMAKSAREIPQFSVSIDVNAGRLLEKLQASANSGNKTSLTALLIQATGKVLETQRQFNAYFENGSVFHYEQINISVAVAVEKELFVPVIHQADTLSLLEISAKLQELIEKTKTNKLSLEDTTNGTFTISNLGMKGIRNFVPLVNPSQAAILGVGEVRDEIRLDSEGELFVEKVFSLTISADHRVVGGYEAADFLQSLRKAIEEKQ